MAKLLIIISIFYSSLVFGEVTDYSLGLGNLTQFVGVVQQDEAGDLNSFDSNIYVSLGAKWENSWWKRVSFYPQLGLAFPKSGRDPLISKFQYFFSGDMGFLFHKFLLLQQAAEIL